MHTLQLYLSTLLTLVLLKKLHILLENGLCVQVNLISLEMLIVDFNGSAKNGGTNSVKLIFNSKMKYFKSKIENFMH